MTRCLVIGKHGQVAQALAAVGGADVYAASREETDLRDADTLRRALDRHRPAFVINAGGFTKVDAAESEPDEAQALNVTGPEALARACSDAGAVLIHLSTDCVFDGRKASPYLASEVPNPLGVYGRTKLEGEQAVLAAVPQSLVVRVSWVFSRYAGNFVRTMLTAAQKRPVVTVVSDQIGGPTYAPDLARALLNMGEQAAEPGFAGWGLYHLAGDDTIGRADMARRITTAQLLSLQLGRIKDRGELSPTQVSLAKWNNCRAALDIARDARDMLGGAGISAEFCPVRHMLNLESVITYEGTESVHQLVVGKELTGVNAF